MVVKQMPDSEYFALDAVDQTALKKFLVSPLAYADYLMREHEPESQFEFGKAAHSMILGSGPEALVKPDRRTKDGKARYAELLKLHEGEDIVWVSSDEYEALGLMRDRIGDYFEDLTGLPEVAMIADDDGLRLKGKADWLPDSPDADGVLRIRDYKTSAKPPTEFPRSCWTYGYHIQAAFYMRLYRMTTDYTGPLGFEFVVQEKTPPYDWKVWKFSEDSPIISQLAIPKIDHALKGIRWFNEHAEDPLTAMLDYGLSKVPEEIVFPDWRLLEEETEIESWR